MSRSVAALITAMLGLAVAALETDGAVYPRLKVADDRALSQNLCEELFEIVRGAQRYPGGAIGVVRAESAQRCTTFVQGNDDELTYSAQFLGEMSDDVFIEPGSDQDKTWRHSRHFCGDGGSPPRHGIDVTSRDVMG